MTSKTFVALIEELIELKLQRYAELNLKLPPALSIMLREKRESDRLRLNQVRADLIRILDAEPDYSDSDEPQRYR